MQPPQCREGYSNFITTDNIYLGGRKGRKKDEEEKDYLI